MADIAPKRDSVNIAIFRINLPDGRLVFQRRTDDAQWFPGMLCFFGGHIEHGENANRAAKRELEEETSLKVDENHLVQSGIYTVRLDDTAHKKVYVYSYEVEDLHFDVFEGRGAEAYSLEAVLKRNDLVRTVRVILEGSVKNEL